MPMHRASQRPQADLGAGLFFISPSTAHRGATVFPAPDWTIFETDTDAPCEWTEEEVVFLHWRLLHEVRRLADPATPLDEKLSTLRWVFTEPDKDQCPFSFVNCLRVVSTSPLSPIAYCGRIDSEEIRDQIASNVKRWLSATLAHYPPWVTDALATNPLWVDDEFARNPQWINEQVKRMSEQGDLFS